MCHDTCRQALLISIRIGARKKWQGLEGSFSEAKNDVERNFTCSAVSEADEIFNHSWF